MKGLIIFLIPPHEVVSGGIMSIFSLAAESRALKKIHKSKVYVCVYPGTETYTKNHLFENSEVIYNFDEILGKNKNIDSLMIHIPEYEVKNILPKLQQRIENFPSDLHINILNQNIEHMPNPDVIEDLYRITENITQTVAHQRYASQKIADTYLIPTHKLMVYLDQSQYTRTDFVKKEKIILYSPDEHEAKANTLQELTELLPDYQLQEINNVTYAEYKKLISRAAYTITYGEGFDGYFIEPTFSGSIPIAVYNDTFFPSPDYKNFANVLNSYDNFAAKAAALIHYLDGMKYDELNKTLTDELKKTYSRPVYTKNIQLFYEKKYTYLPSSTRLFSLFHKMINNDTHEIKVLKKRVEKKQAIISSVRNELEVTKKELASIKHSKAWLYADKIRRISHFGK